MRLDAAKIKELLTNEDITNVLLELGSENPISDNRGRLMFTTICHGGDSSKLYYFPDSYSFYCFTHCHKSIDIYQVVMDTKESQGYEFTFPDALNYVADITGKRIREENYGKQQNDKIDDWDWLERFNKPPKPIDKLHGYDENVLDIFLPYMNDWVDEGLFKETTDLFEVGYYLKKEQITLPHRDINGRLIGIRSRNNDEYAELGAKYIPTIVENVQYNHILSQNLYGIHLTKKGIKQTKKIMFVEGEKSVMKCQKYFGDDNFTVAVCGSNISRIQRDIALEQGVDEVFIAFDKFREQGENESDDRYEKEIVRYQQRLLRLAHMFTPYTRTYILWDYDDLLNHDDSPVDSGKEVLLELMRNKVEIKTKDVVL